ncbi:hypothetical protein [Sulfurimonas sp.]|uniref:hypothetical protein n=1 Tax=Sulfurimonas sp. TaxID=2022749 RepID=UPI002AB02774|nr:hypothetical protein [Sulfurimonas sp.]
MKKFNLFNEIIITNKQKLLTAINSKKLFGICIEGNIIYEPFADNEIFIYKGQPEIVEDFKKVLGRNYQLVEDGDRVLIKAFSNWQELIGINTPNSSYDDTTADGVGEFADKSLEDIGWHIAEFSVDYRTLVELLEEKCEGTVLCIEQVEPYQFSGLGYLSDNKHAKEVLFDYCKAIVKDKTENDPDFSIDGLTDDEEDAAKFFGIV